MKSRSIEKIPEERELGYKRSEEMLKELLNSIRKGNNRKTIVPEREERKEGREIT